MKFLLLVERIQQILKGPSGIKYNMLTSRGGTLDKMAVFSQHQKIIYVVVPKAANSSIKRLIWQDLGVDLEDSEVMRVIHKGNSSQQPTTPLSRVTNKELEKALNSKEWLKFSFVRNPYTRLVSAYQDKIENNQNNKGFLRRLGWHKSHIPSFEEFIDAITLQDINNMDWHWRPQWHLLMMDLISYDFIGKIEKLDNDIKKISNHLSMSDSDAIEAINSKTNSTKSNIENRISDNVALKIFNLYQKDFEYFNYSKNSY